MEDMGPTQKRIVRSKRTASTKVLRPRIKRKQKLEGASSNKRKKIEKGQNIEEKPEDTYCWLCHKECQDRTCGCKRVYHKECLEKLSLVFKYNKCPECRVKTEKRPDPSRPFTGGLKVCLESAVQLVTDKHKTKRLSWSRNTDLIGSINIETLLKKVQDGVYKTTAEFFSDVKWLYHNSCILYGENSKQTKDLNKAINDFKEELYDMEACPECYYHLNVMEEGNDLDKENRFARLCDPPHDIVWARVHGHPYWPAKLLKVTNGKARVRFFGKHEKADVATHTIFHISVSHPSHQSKDIKPGDAHTSLDYAFAKEELLAYIRIYERNIGKFQFSGRRVLYAPISDGSNALIKTQNLTNEVCQTLNTHEPVMSINSPAFGRFLPSRSMSNFPPEPFERDDLSSNRDVMSDMSFCVDTSLSENISSYIGNLASTSRVLNSGLQNVGNTIDRNTPSANSSFQDTSSNPTSSCMSPCSSTNLGSIRIKKENCGSYEPHQISSVYSTSSLSGDLLQLLFQGVTVQEPEQVVEEVVVKQEILDSNPLNNELEGNESRIDDASTNDISNIMENLVTSVSSENTDNYIQERISGNEGEHNAGSNENFTTHIPSIEIHQSENRSATNSTEVLGSFNCGIAQQSQQDVSEVALPSSSRITEIDLTGDDDDVNSSTSLSNLFVKNPKMQQVLANTQKQLGHFLTTVCQEVCSLQRPEPTQQFQDLTRKLNEAEKKFQEEANTLRDQLEHLQKKLDAKK